MEPITPRYSGHNTLRLVASPSMPRSTQRTESRPPFSKTHVIQQVQARDGVKTTDAVDMFVSALSLAIEVASLESTLQVSDPMGDEFARSLADAVDVLARMSKLTKADVVDASLAGFVGSGVVHKHGDEFASDAEETLQAGQWAPKLRQRLNDLVDRHTTLMRTLRDRGLPLPGWAGGDKSSKAPASAPIAQPTPAATTSASELATAADSMSAHQGESTFEVEQQAALEAVTSVDLIAAVQSLIPNLGWEAKVVDTVTQQATPVGAPQVSVLPDGQGLAVTMLTDVVTTTRIEASGTLALENIVSEVKARAATRLEVVEGE